MDKTKICLINDSFPPAIDGVANAVVNYGTYITKNHGEAVVVTPFYPDADDSVYPFPVVRQRFPLPRRTLPEHRRHQVRRLPRGHAL